MRVNGRAWRILVALVVTTIAFALTSGCGGSQKSETPADAAVAAPPVRWAAEKRLADFNSARFGAPTTITNEWLPLKPGTRLSYEGTSMDDDGKVVRRRIEVNVTDLVKTIGGVRSLVSWDLDWADGELIEAELAFYAQDDSGNVWVMGEYPEEYEDGKLTGNPGWIHGVQGANAGIMMRAQPRLGGPSDSQGWGPAIGCTDRSRVDSVGLRVCVPADCYDDVLVIAEGSAGEIHSEQLKYYARGAGNIKVGWRGSEEKEKQVNWLTKIEPLDDTGLARIRSKALELEKGGYAHSNQMYARTPPSERLGGR